MNAIYEGYRRRVALTAERLPHASERCLVKVLSAQVAHLVPVELEEPGTCLTCCAVPLGDLVLDA